jgi:hypothetical protein
VGWAFLLRRPAPAATHAAGAVGAVVLVSSGQVPQEVITVMAKWPAATRVFMCGVSRLGKNVGCRDVSTTHRMV